MDERIKKVIKNPGLLFQTLGQRGFFNWMSDDMYLKLIYRCRYGEKLNLDNPQKFNEKLQWLKINNRRPEYTLMVDKYEAKKYVAGIIGEEYIIPTLGVWDKFEDINFDELPEQFIIKPTHDSGGYAICKDKKSFDIKSAGKKLKRSLKTRYFYNAREWPYKNVKPRIIAEELMIDQAYPRLRDYKFFCFNGEVKVMYVTSDRDVDMRLDFFDKEFNHMPFGCGYKQSDKTIEKPEHFEKMVELAEKISQGIPHARVDFYNINGKIYFGEITFFHWSGMVPIEPVEWEYKLGSWIKTD